MPSVFHAPEGVDTPFIQISGDALIIDPSLKPKPSAGVQVLFYFEFSESDLGYIAGVCSVLSYSDAAPTIRVPDGSNTLDGLTNITETEEHKLLPEHFSALSKWATVELSLEVLAGALTGHQIWVENARHAFLQKALKVFLDSYTVTAEIKQTIYECIDITVKFSRDGSVVHEFEFFPHREDAEQLFEFDKGKRTP